MTLPGRVPASVTVCESGSRLAIADEFRQAEVEDLGETVARDHQVFRLEVAVHDARLMGLREPVGDRGGHLQRAPRLHRPGLQNLSQGLPLDELHAEIGLGLRLPEVVDGDDGRMVERRRCACLELEAAQPVGVVGQLRGQQLQRDVTIELCVAREIDFSHPARTEEGANDVPSETRAVCESHPGCYCAREPPRRTAQRSTFPLIIPACARLSAGILLGLGAAAIILLIGAAGVLERVELILYDWRMRSVARTPPDVHKDIVLVEINDTTIRDLDPVFGRWPWPRVTFSMLVDFLNRAPAKVIAVDLGFYERDRVLQHQIGTEKWSGAESDGALVKSVKEARNTILLADAVYEGLVSGEQSNKAAEWRSEPYRLDRRIFERRTIITPYRELNDAVATLGHSFAALDAGGSLRRIVPFVRSGDRFMPSLGVAAAVRGADIRPDEVTLDGNTLRMRDRAIPLIPVPVKDAITGQTVDQLTMLVNYRAPALLANGERPYRSFEARHIFESEIQLLSGTKPTIDPALFKGKIVFIGLTASGLVDVFQTPFDSRGQGKMPGIQMHASVADSILSNRFITPVSNRYRMVTTVSAALAVGLLAAFLPFTAAAIGSVVVMIAWTVYAWVSFKSGLWVNLSQPVAAMGLALFSGTAYQYFVEGKEKRIVKKLFGRYVSKDVYEQLLEHPERAELGGNRRDMSVLFSDIRGFTSVTEKGDPEDLVAQLNEYLSRMVEIVFRHHGTVDKFVGDMVMALYGAPLDDPDHAEHAVATAVDMVRELGDLNRKWAGENRAQLDIGVGINSGDMIAGNIGSSSIMSYTVIGDNVNLGSRLESLNKDYRTRIIISDATRARLKGAYETAPLGEVVVKGKTRPVTIFEVKVPSPIKEEATI